MAEDAPRDVSGESEQPPAVLVVNDRKAQRTAIGALLDPLGVVVVEADSGRSALRAVLRQPFAVILMDVRMPNMDGYETTRLIRQRRQTRRTPIIFITAHDHEDKAALSAYGSGAVDFLHNPVVPEALRAKVTFFVELFVQSQELQRSLDSITALRATEATTQAVLNNVADGIVIAGESGLIESMNRSARMLFRYDAEELTGQPLTRLFLAEPDQSLGTARSMGDMPGQGVARTATSEAVGRRQDGSTFAMEMEHGEMKLGGRSFTLAFVRDVSERKAYTDQLEYQALHDELTGLANRTLLGINGVQSLASAKRTGEPRAVLVMDLDGFKRVNDTFGHDHGDSLLKQVGERLVELLRDADMVARLGGDEFAILPGGPTDLAAAAAVAWKVQQACAAGFKLGDDTSHVSASIGIALYPEHGKTTAELLGRADSAMYVAKKSGNGQAVFDPAQENQAAMRLALLVDLRNCIGHAELVLHYQPKIDIETHRLSGVEALLRWRHPTQGLLLPGRFMASVERTELIAPVTRWVLNEALRQQQIWRDQGVDLTMAVNISAQSLRSGTNLPDIVAELTETWESPPDSLILELTEGAMIEAAAPDILDRLHDMGQVLAIDDFGTGYSSLAYLQRLPVDELKIDRSFMVRLAAASDDEVIVRSTIDLGHNLGLRVVAEGVESESVLKLLSEHKCDVAQGFLFSRPCAPDELTRWMADSAYGEPMPVSQREDGAEASR